MGEDAAITSSIVGEPDAFRFSADEVVAGAVAGFAEHFVMFPFDTVKTRIQSGRSTGVLEAFRDVLQKERFAHLYRGCVPVLVSAVPAHAAYFGVYEAVKRAVGGEGSTVGITAAACCATVAHDVVSTPFDVVKQRMQMDNLRSFSSSINCIRKIRAAEGVSAFFVSLPTTVAMNIPHYAAYWLTYETLLSHLGGGAVRDYERESTEEHMLGGFIAGAVASVVSFPFDAVKTHKQLGRRAGFVHILGKIFYKRGLRGIFAGVVPRVMYTAPSGAIMMGTYETVKHVLSRD